MNDEEMVLKFADTIITQMRTLGVEFHDDVGERIPRDSAQEYRILNHLARHCAQVTVSKIDCQTAVRESAT